MNCWPRICGEQHIEERLPCCTGTPSLPHSAPLATDQLARAAHRLCCIGSAIPACRSTSTHKVRGCHRGSLSTSARFADRSYLTQFGVLSLLCAVLGFFGSAFTSSPSTTLEAEYAYLLARTAIAALIVLMIYSVHQFGIRPESVAINAPLKPKVIEPLLTLLLMIVLAAEFAVRYAALSMNGEAWFSFVYTPFLTILDLFLSGMLLSKVLGESKSHLLSIRHRDVFLPIGLFVIAAFFVAISVFPQLSGIVGSGFAASISFWVTVTCVSALLVIALFEAADVRSAKDRWSLAHWITAKTQIVGILTYSLYVFSAPVLLSMRKIAPPTLSLPDSLTYFLPVCLLLFAISFTFYQFLERPFEKPKF